MGAGLWNSIPLTVVLEVGTLAVGLVIYLRFTRATDRIGSWGLWAMVLLLLVIWLGALFGPPPADAHALAVTALGIWIFVPWSYWVDRHRVPSAVEERR